MAGLLLQWQVWQTILPSITPTGTSAFVEGCEIIRRCCCKNINSTLMLRWKSFYSVSQYHIYSFLKLGVHDFLTCIFGRRDFKRSCSHRRTGSESRKNTSQTTRENQKTARTSSDNKRLLKKKLYQMHYVNVLVQKRTLGEGKRSLFVLNKTQTPDCVWMFVVFWLCVFILCYVCVR